jgi:chromosome segregation ATPase
VRRGVAAAAAALWRGLRERRRAVGVVAAAVACVAVAGLLVWDWRATLAATDRAEDRLHDTRSSLHRTEADLTVADATADASWASLEAEVEALAARRSEATSAQGTLDATSQALTDLQAQLAAANVELAASSGRLDTLQRCMAGVNEALNQAGARDTAGLARTLHDIEGTCTDAGVQL